MRARTTALYCLVQKCARDENVQSGDILVQFMHGIKHSYLQRATEKHTIR